MTTVRLHSIKSVSSPTIVFIDKGQDTTTPSGEHAIVIEPTKTAQDLRREGNVEIAIPVTREDWGDRRSLQSTSPWTVSDFDFVTQTQNAPGRQVADFTRISHTFVVEGFINRFSSKEVPTTVAEINGDWAEKSTPHQTVFQVRDELKDMFEFGGPIVLEYGITGDGFDITSPQGYRYKVLITGLQFTEESQGPGVNSATDADRSLHTVPQVLRINLQLKVVTEI